MIRTIDAKHLIGEPGINQHFATLVSNYRKQRGYENHQQFAERLKLRKKVITRLEEGGGSVSLGDYFIISMYLGIKVVDLWYFVANQQPCPLARIAIPDHSKKLYGLNEKYYRDANYAKLCRVIDTHVAEHMANLIENCGKSFDEIREPIGKTRSTISKIKSGSRVLRLSELATFCEIIGVQSKDVIIHIMNRMEQTRKESGKAKF